MTDRKEIIRGLDAMREFFGYGLQSQHPTFAKYQEILTDTISLIKEREPKTGKWILDDEDANSWECSECGGLLQINDGTPHENDWHFCPYCGTKLEEEKVKLDD